MFCGIDWASERHAVCVLDDAGRKATAFQAAHTTDGLEQLVARLRRHGDPARLPVAIERPGGRLVDRVPYDPAKHGNARKLTETAASAAQG